MYHARTVRAHPKFLTLAAMVTASAPAFAQSTGEGEPRAEQPAAPAAGYPAYPGERHIFARAVGGVGAQFNNAWGQGVLAPIYGEAHVGFTFINAGPMRLGFELGGQVGVAVGAHMPPQYTLNPGVVGMVRFTPALALTVRLDVPILFTRGLTQYSSIAAQMPNAILNTGPTVYAPTGRTYSVGFGLEAGIGLAYYLTAGFALTAEVSPTLYFGDAFYTYPGVAGAIGVLFDYEVMP